MADVRTLTAELEQVKARAQAILTEFKDGMTAEKRSEFTALASKATALSTEIKAEKDLEESKAQLSAAADFLDKPQYKVPRAVTPDEDGRKAILAAGWEVKAGTVYAPHSLVGKKVRVASGEVKELGPTPMFSEEVLFGEIPTDDADAAAYFKQTRAAMQPIYRVAYGKYLRFAVKMRDTSMAFNMLAPDEQKALTEGTDTAGGFLVPPDLQSEVLSRIAQRAVVRGRARVQATSRDVLRWPAVAPHATSASIYSSGFVGGWVGETPAFTETDPAFQLFDIPVRKLRVATKLSNDFIADSVVNILAFLAQNGGENAALVEDNGFIAGDGGSLQPMGLLNAGIATVDVEGSTANTISNASGAGSSTKIVTLAYTLPAQYASGASWLMRRSIEGKVRNLNDSGGRPLWPAYSGSAFAPAPTDLLGSPVDNSDFMPSDGTDAFKVFVYGDFSNYIIAQRAQITSVVLRERFADTDQTGIILFERVGGHVWNLDAFRIGVV